jgi:hypothetical protein
MLVSLLEIIVQFCSYSKIVISKYEGYVTLIMLPGTFYAAFFLKQINRKVTSKAQRDNNECTDTRKGG